MRAGGAHTCDNIEIRFSYARALLDSIIEKKMPLEILRLLGCEDEDPFSKANQDFVNKFLNQESLFS